jgi:ribonuclease inhibitor
MEVNMIIEIDGKKILSESEFHKEIAEALKFGPYYGNNLNALWDVLTLDVERPIRLLWKDADISRQAMPSKFTQIIELLREVEIQDAEYNSADRFELVLD